MFYGVLMSFIFIYQYKNISKSQAEIKFTDALNKQSTVYENLCGRKFPVKIAEVGPVFIGQIAVDYNIKGWVANAESETHGVFWSGICEEYLDYQYTSKKLYDLYNIIDRYPEKVSDWDGRFSLCTWNKLTGRAILITSSTESTNMVHKRT